MDELGRAELLARRDRILRRVLLVVWSVMWPVARLSRFSRYARAGPRLLGIDPVLVRVDLE
jgi:hypothetical protein